MKILYFTKYSRKGASSRLRSYQYFPFGERRGFEISVQNLFDDNYLKLLYSGKSVKFLALKSYIKRFFSLFEIWKYDYLVIEKELFPYFPALAERLLNLLKVKYVADYDDAIFHNYDLNPNPLISFLLRKKIDKVMKNSTIVIAGNNYLADRAIAAGAEKVEVIPTVVNLDRYKKKIHTAKEQVVIGWIGTHSTFKYVKNIREVLKKLIEEYNVLIHIIGTDELLGLGENEIHITWTEDTELDSILKFDIGIMPLLDSPWEQGKCAYKLIQYMACSLPVVASPVGVNKKIVSQGRGFFAEDDSQWFDALAAYISQLNLRIEHGAEGFRLIESSYSLEKISSKYYDFFK